MPHSTGCASANSAITGASTMQTQLTSSRPGSSIGSRMIYRLLLGALALLFPSPAAAAPARTEIASHNGHSEKQKAGWLFGNRHRFNLRMPDASVAARAAAPVHRDEEAWH